MSANRTKAVRALGIVGSPRRRGNTDVLVDEVLAGAKEQGAAFEKVYLGRLDISPCRACDTCKKTGVCVVQDDMQSLLKKMRAADVWVLGTPVYFWGPTGWFKAFVDRWYGARKQVRFEDKHAVVVVPMEDTNPATARHTTGMMQDTLDHVKTPLVTTVVAPGVLKRGAVQAKIEAMRSARRAGRDAAARAYAKRQCHPSD
ncbi:MAG: flavodoxin family protein [candidate division Zixibacteria bacterium]|nr:flavodoxin family protein [candidate division Zixibacteria bacterium]